MIALPMPLPGLSVQAVSSWLPILFRLWLEREARLPVQQSAPPHTTLTKPKLHNSMKGALLRLPGKTS